MFLEQLSGLIFKLKNNSEAKHFFNNGACSKLVEYLYHEFLLGKENVQILFRLRIKYQIQKTEMEEDILCLDGYEFISCYDQIDHIAIVHNNLIYDVNGIKTLPPIGKLNNEENYFYCAFPVENQLEFSQLLDLVFSEHKYGYLNKREIKEKIENFIKI